MRRKFQILSLAWLLISFSVLAVRAEGTASDLVERTDEQLSRTLTSPGGCAVGFTTIVDIDPSRKSGNENAAGRPVAVSIWYPAGVDKFKPDSPEASYPANPLEPEGNSMPSAAWKQFGLPPVYSIPIASSQGPFPMLLFSHGLGGDPGEQVSLATHLASHGIIFAAVYHPGEVIDPEHPESFPFAEMLRNRPMDMSFLLDRILERSRTPGDLLHGLVDPDRIAAGGFSLGGYTAMALAGGDDNVRDISRLPPGLADPFSWMNLTGAGLSDATVKPDPRFKALVLLSASGWILHLDEMRRVNIPSLSIGEEWDSFAVEFGGNEIGASAMARQHLALSEKATGYRVDVLNTVHQSFTDACRILELSRTGKVSMMPPEEAAALAAKLCDPYTGSDIVQGIIARYSLAFLVTHLQGRSEFAHVLQPDWAMRQETHAEFFEPERETIPAGTPDWPGLSAFRMHQKNH